MATDPTGGARARRLGRRAARRAGNAEAHLLRELHEQHAGALWSYALSLTGDHDQAQEVVQETLLRASRNPRLLGPEAGSQRSSLYAVAQTLVTGEHAASRHLVAGALGRLTPEHREVLRECYFRGSSIAHAAKVLEITPEMVKSRAYYALRALRLAIEELGGLP